MSIEQTISIFKTETDQMNDFSKKEYLEWKSSWKYIYKELSKEIRLGKQLRKTSINGYVSGLYYKRILAASLMDYRMMMKDKSIKLKEKLNDQQKM